MFAKRTINELSDENQLLREENAMLTLSHDIVSEENQSLLCHIGSLDSEIYSILTEAKEKKKAEQNRA